MSLYQDFQTNQGRAINKWLHYFPAYERHFGPWRNKTLLFIEIGVSFGGSLQMWHRYLGPYATIVGIDINPACSFEEPNVYVRTGDQSDHRFLQSIIDEFGTPDLVLDDGSHRMSDVRATFDFLYPKLSKNGIYMVEDMHTSYWQEWGGSVNHPLTFINYSKLNIDKLNAHFSKGQVPIDFITNNTLNISFYDSIVVYERGSVPVRTAPSIGQQSFSI